MTINVGYLEHLVSESITSVLNSHRTVSKSYKDISCLVTTHVRNASKGFVRKVALIEKHCHPLHGRCNHSCHVCRDKRSIEEIYDLRFSLLLKEGSELYLDCTLYHDYAWNRFRVSAFSTISE